MSHFFTLNLLHHTWHSGMPKGVGCAVRAALPNLCSGHLSSHVSLIFEALPLGDKRSYFKNFP